jgi:hypothetical protein
MQKSIPSLEGEASLSPDNARVLRVNRLPNWWDRHRKSLTIVGGVVLLATYTVKEITIDRLREKIVKIESAQSTYDSQQQFHLIRTLLEQPKHAGVAQNQAETNAGALYIYQYVSIGVELQLLNDLNSGLEGNDDQAAVLTQLGRKLGERGIWWGAADLGEPGHASSNEEARKYIDGIELSVYQEQGKLREIANKQWESANSSLHFATIASALLYLVGWILTFSRNIFGNEAVDFGA